MRVLVVDDDPVSTSLLQAVLQQQDFVVESTDQGENALQLIRTYDFDAMVLDPRLPDMDDGAVLRRLRASGSNLPVIVLSSVDDRTAKIQALFDGADDYLTKPVDRDELLARLKSVVRRAKGHASSQIRIGRLALDLASRTVTIDGVPLKVTAKEYNILELLALRRGTTLSKEVFLDHLYGGRDEPEQKIIDVFITKLRKKIASLTGGNSYIKTIWGQGYALSDESSNSTPPNDISHFSKKERKRDEALSSLLENIVTVDKFDYKSDMQERKRRIDKHGLSKDKNRYKNISDKPKRKNYRSNRNCAIICLVTENKITREQISLLNIEDFSYTESKLSVNGVDQSISSQCKELIYKYIIEEREVDNVRGQRALFLPVANVSKSKDRLSKLAITRIKNDTK